MKVSDKKYSAPERGVQKVGPAPGSASAPAARKAAKKSGAPARSVTVRKASNTRSNLKQVGKAESKQNRVIALLQRPEGATLSDLVKATGWQPHSVRGFLAGTIRKKLKLPLHSEKVKGARTYRTKLAKAAAKASSSRTA